MSSLLKKHFFFESDPFADSNRLFNHIYHNIDDAHVALLLLITRLPDWMKPMIIYETLQKAFKFCKTHHIVYKEALTLSSTEASKSMRNSKSDSYCDKQHNYLKSLLSHCPNTSSKFALSTHLLMKILKSISSKDLKPFSSNKTCHFLAEFYSTSNASRESNGNSVQQVPTFEGQQGSKSPEKTFTLPQPKRISKGSSEQVVGQSKQQSELKHDSSSASAGALLEQTPSQQFRNDSDILWTRTPSEHYVSNGSLRLAENSKVSSNFDWAKTPSENGCSLKNSNQVSNDTCISNRQTCHTINWSKTSTNAAGECKLPRRLNLSETELPTSANDELSTSMPSLIDKKVEHIYEYICSPYSTSCSESLNSSLDFLWNRTPSEHYVSHGSLLLGENANVSRNFNWAQTPSDNSPSVTIPKFYVNFSTQTSFIKYSEASTGTEDL